MKKQPAVMMTEDFMTEDDHGLGINKVVPRAVVEKLEQHIMSAATVAILLGVSYERFSDLCDAAFDTAFYRGPDETVLL
jgi:hypothetical protein